MQVGRQLIHSFGLPRISRLGDLDAHELGRQIVLVGECPHMLGNVAGKDIHARHVERDRNHAKPSIDAPAQPRGNALPNVFVERHHKTAFLESGDKGDG